MRIRIPGQHRLSPKAFTLVELLVVIAIIAAMAGLLMPALATAKGQVRRIACNNNQRQLWLTWNLYADDYGDTLAPNGHDVPDQEGAPRLWIGADDHFFLPSFTNTQYLLDPRYAAFGGYLASAAIYKCPEDRSLLNRVAGVIPLPQVRSYSINAYMGWITTRDELSPSYRVFQKLSDMNAVSPARLFVFQDVHPNSICMPAFMTYLPGGTVDGFYHYPSPLHHGSGVVNFADGHMENRKWQDARTLKPVSSEILTHWNHAPHNADIDWLRERTSDSLADDAR